ncbi:hypothetical protein BC826DRAFT_193486 [Russula brevipes]|nr:hypothetical protein BC826DRAFT_193486 [Russula brevipes]
MFRLTAQWRVEYVEFEPLGSKPFLYHLIRINTISIDSLGFCLFHRLFCFRHNCIPYLHPSLVVAPLITPPPDAPDLFKRRNPAALLCSQYVPIPGLAYSNVTNMSLPYMVLCGLMIWICPFALGYLYIPMPLSQTQMHSPFLTCLPQNGQLPRSRCNPFFGVGEALCRRGWSLCLGVPH